MKTLLTKRLGDVIVGPIWAIVLLFRRLKASASADQERVSDLFYLKRADAFLSSERVSVYLIEQGKATNMIEEDGVLELHTFGDVSERISDIF
jgi:hypothetical protein